jgi:GNAT superfamily N-acetyltransferase
MPTTASSAPSDPTSGSPPPAHRIRRLTDSDRESWLELWDGYLRFYRASLASSVTDATFERLCDGADGMLGLVAVDADGALIGLANLVFHAATWTRARRCYLEDLFVAASARGSGAGAALIKAACAAARRRGADRIYWHTQQYNGPARSLYDTLANATSFVVYERDLNERPLGSTRRRS